MEDLTMSKISIQDLASVISKKHGITLKEAVSFVAVLFEVVNTGLKSDRQVKIKGLGTFKLIDVRDRESINVNTGERIVIDGRSKITFTPDAIMRDLVNRPFAQFDTVVINDGVDIAEFDNVDKQAEASMDDKDDVPDTTPVVEEPEAMSANDGSVKKSADEVYVNDEKLYEEKIEHPDAGNSTVSDAEDINNKPVSETDEIVNDRSDDIPCVDADDEYLTEKSIPGADYISGNITENEENMPADNQSAKEEMPEPCDGDSEIDDDDIEEKQHPSMLRKALLFIVSFLLIAVVAAYMGYYFGQKSATDDSTVAAVAKKDTVMLLPPTAVIDTTVQNADSVKAVAAKDTVAKNDAKAGKAEVKEVNDQVAAQKKDEQDTETKKKSFSDRYDKENVMVRTGAYRIVGVERTVVLKKGQTLASVSKSILGPGMECYIEALNGVRDAGEGQSLKIPKLELRKKKRHQ